MAAIVARPLMVDPAHELASAAVGKTGVEAGFFGDKKNAAAVGTIRPAEILARQPWR